MKSLNSNQEQPLHVCIIGAGVCGIVSIKSCLEAGLKVTCFEKSARFGGLWNYRPTQSDGTTSEPSVMRTTILNTSKELSAFSDYPPPANLANFMKHNHYMDYIRSYVEHFQLLSHIKFHHQIISCQPEWIQIDSKASSINDDNNNNNHSHVIKWSIKVLNVETGIEFTQQFDRLMIAIGHHNIPFVPTLNCQHRFKGKIIHSADVKDILTDTRFIDKRVLVVGLGNSACDAANDLAIVSSKCYVSCHRGNWFISRLDSEDGLYDFKLKSRWYNYLSKALPTKITDRFLINKLERRTNHTFLGLRPRHQPSEQVPAINDLFPYRILTGGICLKGSVLTFTENGVVFQGEEDEEYKVDIVVLATGYEARISFLNERQLGLKAPEPYADEYDLYLNMFAPKLNIDKPNDAQQGVATTDELDNEAMQLEAIKSLVFIGLVQPSGSITVVSELQSRYAVQLFTNQLKLPSVKQMMEHIDKIRRSRSKAIRSHSKDQLVGNWIGYLDFIASKMDSRPNMSHLFFKDPSLWRQLMFGPSVPYQYRLQGPNKWAKARETILMTNERVHQGINDGKNHALFKCRQKCLRPLQTTMNGADKNGCNANGRDKATTKLIK